MEISRFLELGIEIEMKISRIYSELALLAENEELAEKLRSISDEEINHANSLRMGKKFHIEMPDLFAGINLADEEITLGVQEAGILLDSLGQGIGFVEGIKKILDLEKRFEHVHMAASVTINEPSLKHLFQGLTKGDQDHIRIVSKIL
jgi:hypothetical protein